MRNTVVIVFSKDRAMQLDACLRSFFLHCADASDAAVFVLYTTSAPAHRPSYDELARHFDAVGFIPEKHFKKDILGIIGGGSHVLFVTDDTVFLEDFTLREATGALDADRSAIAFSLRLGSNIVHCYPLDAPQAMPASEEFSPSVLRFNWTEGERDFHYPLELSSSLYRVADIAPLLHRLRYGSPNTLEEELAGHAHHFASSHPHMLCPRSSAACAIPANRVQTEHPNRAGSDPAHSTERLLAAFESGRRIALEPFQGFVPRSCHEEVALVLADVRSESPKVTVVIVNHNYASFLQEAIDSVLLQSYRNFELLIIDNASGDGSADIARRCAGRSGEVPVRVIVNEENAGQTHARRQGFAMSRAKYLLPLDADDKIGSRFLEATVDALESHPSAGIAYVDALTFGEENWVHVHRDYPLKSHARKNCFAYCSLMRRSAYEAVGGYDPDNWGSAEDWELWLSLRERGWEPVHVRKVLFYYRAHRSLSTRHEALHEFYNAYVRLRHPSLYSEDELARDRERLRWMPDGWLGRSQVRSQDEIIELIRRFHPNNRHWLAELARLIERQRAAGNVTDETALKEKLGNHFDDYLNVVSSFNAEDAPIARAHDFTLFHITDGSEMLAKSHYSVQCQTDQGFILSILPGMSSFGAAFQAMTSQCTTRFFIDMDDETILLPRAMAFMKTVMTTLPENIGLLSFLVWDRRLRRPVPALHAWRTEACRAIPTDEALVDVSACAERFITAGFRSAAFPELLGTRGRYATRDRILHRFTTWYRNTVSMNAMMTKAVRSSLRAFRRTGSGSDLQRAVIALLESGEDTESAARKRGKG